MAMAGHTVTESQTRTAGRAPGPTIWHYEGLGIRESFAKPRLWVLGTCIAVAATIYGYLVIAPRGASSLAESSSTRRTSRYLPRPCDCLFRRPRPVSGHQSAGLALSVPAALCTFGFAARGVRHSVAGCNLVRN